MYLFTGAREGIGTLCNDYQYWILAIIEIKYLPFCFWHHPDGPGSSDSHRGGIGMVSILGWLFSGQRWKNAEMPGLWMKSVSGHGYKTSGGHLAVTPRIIEREQQRNIVSPETISSIDFAQKALLHICLMLHCWIIETILAVSKGISSMYASGSAIMPASAAGINLLAIDAVSNGISSE